jgi:hypothetical protein
MDINIDEVGSSLTHQLNGFMHLFCPFCSFIYSFISFIHVSAPFVWAIFEWDLLLIMASMFGEGRKKHSLKEAFK